MKIGINISDSRLFDENNSSDIVLPQKISARSKLFESIGFDFLTSNETKANPFVPLSIGSESTTTSELISSIALAFVRSPMDLAYISWDLQRISNGRFVLGLGSQVRGHVVRRFSGEWHPPISRMREYIESLTKIWNCWQNGDKLNIKGDYYNIDLMTPFFNPGPISNEFPKIILAAVNANMSKLSGELSDGIILHGFSTKKYVQKVLLPEIKKGKKYKQLKDEFIITSGGFLIISDSEKNIQSKIEQIRSQVAFYASTKSYRKVMEIHGWENIADQLYRYSVDGKWDKMPSLITDDVLDEFLLVSSLKEAPKKIKSKFNYANYLSIPIDVLYEFGIDQTKNLVNKMKSG
tara:strand:- start:2198 stop:3247 length:1050 start_codon:yes stop_codon:yes gene_type:complete